MTSVEAARRDKMNFVKVNPVSFAMRLHSAEQRVIATMFVLFVVASPTYSFSAND
jgi:hypothetical protein